MCELLETGVSLRGACAQADLPRSSLYAAMAKRPELGDRLERATERGLGQLEVSIASAAAMDWRAARELLAVKAPETWSRKAQLEHAGRVQLEARVIGPPGPEISRLLADPAKARVLFDLLDEDDATAEGAR